MSLIVHYCRCSEGLNCSIIQQAVKLQESIKEYINLPESKYIIEECQEWASYKSGQQDILEKVQSLIEELEK